MMGGRMIKTGAVVDLLKSGSLMMERESDGAVLKADKLQYWSAGLEEPEKRYHLAIHVQAVAGGHLVVSEVFHSQSASDSGHAEWIYMRAARCIIEQIRAGFEICADAEQPSQTVALERVGR